MNEKIDVFPEEKVSKTINFKCYEVIGSEIFKPKDYESPIWSIERENGYFSHKMALKNFNDIKVGDNIMVPTLFGYAEANIISLDVIENKGIAKTENDIFCLEFDKDERHCWICNGQVNMKALDRIKI
jgi:hypothetical protein